MSAKYGILENHVSKTQNFGKACQQNTTFWKSMSAKHNSLENNVSNSHHFGVTASGALLWLHLSPMWIPCGVPSIIHTALIRGRSTHFPECQPASNVSAAAPDCCMRDLPIHIEREGL
jgi:hypothetical protein